MAWVKTNPTDSGLLVNFPGQQRANNDAIELGNDAALLITDAKVAVGAAIQESKLLFASGGHGHTGGTGGKQIVLTTAVSGTLPVGNGGTGATAAANTANGVVVLDGSGKVNVSFLTGTLPRAQGGLASTVANNAASGVVFLDASSKLPAVDGSQLTGLSAVPTGCILLWSGSIATIPTGYVLCNGSNGTPDLRNRFVMAAGDTYAVGSTGNGSIPAHTHNITNYGIPNWDSAVHFSTAAGDSRVPQPITTSSSGTGTINIAVYYALAYIMKS